MNPYSIKLSRSVKQILLMLSDYLLLFVTLIFSMALLGQDFFAYNQSFYIYLLAANFAGILLFGKLGLYRAIVLYMGFQSVLVLLQGITAATALVAAAIVLSGNQLGTSYPLLGIYWMMSLLLIGGSRFVAKMILQALIQNFRPKEPVIIYGAGSSGMQLVAALQSGNQYLPVAFVDDGQQIVGSMVHGVRVYNPNALYDLIESYSVRQILLAIPSATHTERKEILNRLEHLPVHIKTVPDLFEMVTGRMGVDEIRDVDIEDLLGRDTVPPNPELLGACITGQSVMVTGAAGSIGAELCRQIILLHPARLVLLDNFEFGLYAIEGELQETLAGLAASSQVEIVSLLGSVCNRVQMENAIAEFQLDTVYHAAAYKQVPMVEKNIIEGVQNNIFGTLVAASAAAKFGVKNFVFISTDKAVRPTNVMGATKRFAEQILQAMSRDQKGTRFSMVRFGNVLGSSGSVVPLFRRQIAQGGPITVTHPEVTRYFMTVQEAAQLVIQAGSMAGGGDVFVLDMHEPIKIIDLAKKMIHLMGYDVKDEKSYRGDIAIEYTGLRPGEKLYEELLIGESVTGTDHPKILRAEEEFLPWSKLAELIDQLRSACEKADLVGARELLVEAVDGFEPQGDVMDPLWPSRRQAQLPLEASEAEPGSRLPAAKVTKLFKE